jgi:hypothetical protein
LPPPISRSIDAPWVKKELDGATVGTGEVAVLPLPYENCSL